MRTTVVDLLGGGDGSAALLSAARSWASGEAGDVATGATSPAALEAWMDAHGSMLPNTEVTVVFGRNFHLAGYPAWQLHKSEIYQAGWLLKQFLSGPTSPPPLQGTGMRLRDPGSSAYPSEVSAPQNPPISAGAGQFTAGK